MNSDREILKARKLAEQRRAEGLNGKTGLLDTCLIDATLDYILPGDFLTEEEK